MKTVLVYGDSLSWGRVPGRRDRHPFEARWTNILAARLGDDVRVVEECLPGRTTVFDDPFQPGRNGRDSLAVALESHAPIDLFVLMLGTNDMKAVYGATAFEAAQGAATLLDMVAHSGAGPDGGAPRLLLMAPPAITKPRGALSGKFRGAADKTKGFSMRFGAVATQAKAYYFEAGSVVTASRDGVHLDMDSNAKLAAGVLPVVARALGVSPTPARKTAPMRPARKVTPKPVKKPVKKTAKKASAPTISVGARKPAAKEIARRPAPKKAIAKKAAAPRIKAGVKKPAAKKAVAKKAAAPTIKADAKKPAAKKAVAKKSTAPTIKAGIKKPAPRKPTAKATAPAIKAGVKKPAPRKPTAKATAPAIKAGVRKPAPKKPAAKRKATVRRGA